MSSKSPLFEDLTPPPGGLTRFRARLDEEQHRRKWFGRAALAAAPLALGLVLFWLRPAPPRLELSVWTNPALARFGAPMPTEAVSPADPSQTAVVEVLTENPDVIFYWVATTKPTR